MSETALSRPVATSRLGALWNSMIGKKIVMAVTGGVLILFLFAHVAGNLKIFVGAEQMNAYARFLREVGQPEFEYGQVLWIVRFVLLACALLHITAAYQLTMMNRRARPVNYASKKEVETTLAARTMRIGGVLLLVFIVFHLLHFTLGAVGFQPGQFVHLAAYQNVIAGFSVVPVALFYILAMCALFLHLDHGIWSGFQTLGWSTAKTQKGLRSLSRIVAAVVSLGFISVPLAVMAGWVH
jgi:succinate dehydrogenase / fumarate reductase cytochrome b subunit